MVSNTNIIWSVVERAAQQVALFVCDLRAEDHHNHSRPVVMSHHWFEKALNDTDWLFMWIHQCFICHILITQITHDAPRRACVSHKTRLVVALLLPVLIFSHALCSFSSRRNEATAGRRRRSRVWTRLVSREKIWPETAFAPTARFRETPAAGRTESEPLRLWSQTNV